MPRQFSYFLESNFFDVFSKSRKASKLYTKVELQSPAQTRVLLPFPKDLPSFRLRVFPKDLLSFALFLIWQNKFPYLPFHVTIIWSTITLLIQFYSLSLSYFNPFLFVYLS